MIDDDKYGLVLKAYDNGYLCRGCENKIYYGTYYNGLVNLCKCCKIFETVDCDIVQDIEDLVDTED